MKKIITIKTIFLFLILSSCGAKKKAQEVDIKSLESVLVSKIQSKSDTILTLTEIHKSPYAEKTVVTIYKKGNTFCFINSNYYSYSDTLILNQFDWKYIFSALENIPNEKPIPAYNASVIENDTTWTELNSYQVNSNWTGYLYLTDDLKAWETNQFLFDTNPSLTKNKLTQYILDLTIYRLQSEPFDFGKRKRQKIKTTANNK
jgi:hypothetical protein